MGTTASRSLRCTPALWDAARERAEKEGMSLNRLLVLLLEGYAQGAIDTPQVVVKY